MKKELRIEYLSPDEFQQRMDQRPILYLPCGLIEWHGHHLPLGLDGLKMYGTILGCAERTGGVVLPLNWIGAPGFGSFCGSMTYSPAFVKDLLKQILRQCGKMGAKVVALTTGHYGKSQEDTVRAAGAEFMAEHPEVLVLARPEFEGATVDGAKPADHGGKWETSMGMALFPELVHMDRHRPGVEDIRLYAEQWADWDEEKEPWKWWQDLREVSSPELGQKAVKAIQDSIVAGVEDLCRKAGI
jgi:creatinine amidohydrolase